MQKRTERLAKITILPATDSNEKIKYFSFRETSEIYKQITKLIESCKITQ